VLLGDMITPGTTCDLPLNHYSLIRTIERNFGLGSLAKNDAAANWIRPLWNEHFAWGAPRSADLQPGGNLALATIQTVPRLILSDASGLQQAVLNGDKWVPAGKVDIPATPERFELAACGDAALLVWANADDSLCWSLSPDGTGWSTPKPVPHAKATGSFALSAYTDPTDATADETAKTMLVWRQASGFMQSCVFCNGAWQDQQAVGQLTDGPMALAQFGPSLFLTYKERNTRHMRMTSYNLAPFNAFKALAFDGTAAPQNDTTLHEWNAADFHVGHFARKFAAQQNDYQAMGGLALAAIDGEMRLVHRGAYSDTPSAFEETFALTGILTSGNAYSNGYGTLDQAGWTVETELPGVQLDPDSAIAMTASGDDYVLVWQDSKTKALSWRRGGYKAR
jgi:hypothetical protein